ncbi:NAD-dependent malic enzyme [Ornithinimicrobium sufpigmenti]|uniref:NAD-dependent malic enzyme n=1 Tax=Ornithinimicrobium sufpigmenti TaxID=2508882 RepID=UPI00103668A6|nr:MULTISPECIES: NAD-dependent malic enzyme [unclassified Ornithinimicrobium]
MPRQYQFRTVEGEETVQIAVRGRQVLARPMLNFGPGFTPEQRRALGLTGLLPPAVNTLTEQVRRTYDQFRGQPDALSKYVFLNALQDLNEILYYRLVAEHLPEMLPIIYTPTVGEAIQKFSATFDRPRGIYLSIDDADGMDEALAAHGQGPEDVDLVVVTDSEGILGIGDQGVGGIRIAVGKLAVYTTAAGIHPLRGVPIVLDVGTDNLDLLNDPNYLGARHARVRGERYDQFVAQFVDAVTRHYPHALLHWEDFGADNAHRILATYQEEHCSFNDDIQGTAAVVAGAVLAAVRAKGERLRDQRIVVHGAGTAGIGVADLLRDLMVDEGLSTAEAERRFWGLGSRGLLHAGTTMRSFQRRYARPESEVLSWQVEVAGRYDLAEVVGQVQPTVLIGASAQPGAFTEAIVRDMAAGCDRPVIMPLSNPTARAEADPQDLLAWTDGRAMIATGSPFGSVSHGGATYEIAQANNALVFPGIGLGAVAVRATRVTDGMVAAAARAVAERAPAGRGAALLPPMSQLRSVSAAVAIRVAEAAMAEGVATRELANPLHDIHQLMWQPVYPRVEAVSHIEEPTARPVEQIEAGVG